MPDQIPSPNQVSVPGLSRWQSRLGTGQRNNLNQIIQEQLVTRQRNQLIGTPEKDVLTGTRQQRLVYGRGGNDIITSSKGVYRVWGEGGKDSFVTLNDTKGHLKIMDFQVGETIAFCGCPFTRVEQRGKDAWIVKGDDVKAVVIGTKATSLDLNFSTRLITFVADPLA